MRINGWQNLGINKPGRNKSSYWFSFCRRPGVLVLVNDADWELRCVNFKRSSIYTMLPDRHYHLLSFN